MLRRDICVPALLLLAAATGWTQDSRGSITGRVVDPQGCRGPGAQVVITQSETNIVNRTATNETGYFEVNLLNPGTYSVATEAAGFKKTFAFKRAVTGTAAGSTSNCNFKSASSPRRSR